VTLIKKLLKCCGKLKVIVKDVEEPDRGSVLDGGELQVDFSFGGPPRRINPRKKDQKVPHWPALNVFREFVAAFKRRYKRCISDEVLAQFADNFTPEMCKQVENATTEQLRVFLAAKIVDVPTVQELQAPCALVRL